MPPLNKIFGKNFIGLFKQPAPRILIASNPVDNEFLHKKSNPVKFPLDDRSSTVIELMKRYACVNSTDFIGLAAPQLGYDLNILLISMFASNHFPAINKAVLKFFINPSLKLIPKFGSHLDWESCYSVPGMVGEVSRFNRVEYTAYDVFGKQFKGIAKGEQARFLQHEVDHLNGILYPDRINKGNRFVTEAEFIKILEDQQTKSSKLKNR